VTEDENESTSDRDAYNFQQMCFLWSHSDGKEEAKLKFANIFFDSALSQ